jgi:hypothetical protein
MFISLQLAWLTFVLSKHVHGIQQQHQQQQQHQPN